MKILLATAGSRGDVEPFVAFARYAAARGHTVRLALPDRSGVDTAGIDTASLDVDYSALIEDQGVSVVAALRSFRTVVKPIMRAVLLGSVTVALDFEPDVLLYHPKVLSAPIIGERLGIPHIAVELVPAMTPTSAFAAAGTTTANLGPLNRLTYSAVGASAKMFSAELAEARGIAGVAGSRTVSPPAATLVPISPSILPRPQDWPPSVHLTGAWMGESGTAEENRDVAAFISAGDFVYAGFGSMAAGDPHARGRALVEAAQRTGSRLLVTTGLGGIVIGDHAQGGDVLVTRSVDHASVLPRAAVAIHHGGIGTLQAVARAGVTSIIVPFIADQPFWGAQMHRNRLGPRPIPQRSLTADRLVDALRAAPDYGARSREVAASMALEDGLREALAVVESAAGSRRS